MRLPTNDDELLLLHNPRCSKSRAVKALLEERAARFEVREYLEDALSRAELEELGRRLKLAPKDWLRHREAAAEGVDPHAAPEVLLAAMVRAPALVERPILIRGERALIGRPPEAVATLLD